MKPHGWDASWFQHGESLWSLANKLAYVAAASVGDVLRILAGVSYRGREGWLFPTLDHARAVCESLDLPFGLARGMFAALDTPSLAERVHWQLAIRFCRQCLAGFVHRASFQDLRVTRCAVHGCALHDVCPHCLSPIDPLCNEAWACNYCQGPLVEVKGDWSVAYREGRGGRVPPPSPADSSGVGLRLGGWWHVDRRRVVQEAYEEHSALCSSLLADHFNCAPRERQAVNAIVAPVWFDCPLVALAVFTGNQLGFDAQCTDGAWMPRRSYIASAKGLAFLEGALSPIPESEHWATTRLFTRMWFAEALKSFSQAVEVGRDSALWMPSPDPRFDVNGRPQPVPPEQELVDLVARAAHGCRLQQAPVHDVWPGVSAA